MTKVDSARQNYQARPAEPAAARGEIVRLWSENLRVSGSLDARFRWVFESPPAGSGSVYLLVAQSGGGERVVGTAGLGARRFSVHGCSVTGGLLVDLAVDRGHRSFFPALKLVRAVRSGDAPRFGFLYGVPNTHSRPVFERAGYSTIGTVTRYACLLRAAEYASRDAGASRASRAAGSAVDRALLLPAMIRRASTSDGLRLSWQAQPDGRFDRLWEDARREFVCVGRRDSAFLRWRFTEHPTKTFEFAALTDSTGQRLAAYAVLRISGEVAVISDFFGHLEAVPALLDRLHADLYRRGARSMSLRYFGSEKVTRILRGHGLRARESTEPVILCPGGEFPLDESALSADGWHHTDADGDTQ
jgi:hypothetical protein